MQPSGTGLPAPQISRRAFIALGAAGLAAACSSGSSPAARSTTTTSLAVPRLADDPFGLGVASGDPLSDAVILWTRLIGEDLPPRAVPVQWQIARDESFSDLAGEGTAIAQPELAHSVHVDSRGLEPASWYFYRFRVGDWTSPTGRTRTAPAPGSNRLRFAFTSCQNYEDGLYAAHRHLAEEDLDLVVFLGDYIYESGVNPDALRQHDGPEVQTLAQYRDRYALYKSDENLQASHAARPWIVTWDDHEVDNNYAGEHDEKGTPPEEFLARRAAAYQAWYEHQPVRLDPPRGPDLRIYRRFDWGDLLRFVVLDTRQYRTEQPCDAQLDLGPACEEAYQQDQTMLGASQESWLAGELESSTAPWTVLAQQVVMFPMRIGVGPDPLLNLDQWDGYPLARQRVLERLAELGATNPLVITGDIHASGVADLRADPLDGASPIVASELVSTSVSSLFPEGFADVVEQIASTFPDVHFAEFRHRGYVRCEVSPERLVADYRLVEDASSADSPVSTASSWQLTAGERGIAPA